MNRLLFLQRIEKAFEINPIVAILGPRQCGKTTLARAYFSKHDELPSPQYFDLEDYQDLNRLEDPKLALQSLPGLIVIDEIQRLPGLFQTLRVLIDQGRAKQRYLILGSASRDLIKQSSETLAGRISYLELTPFTLTEVSDMNRLWIRGGFPLSYLAKDESQSFAWRQAYIQTFLERDIPALGIKIPAMQLFRFWSMLAHFHGQLFNASELGRSLGLSDKTMRHYLDILCGTFMVRALQPYWVNLKKRQVKSSKIYLRDTGILHQLFNIETQDQLLTHPKLGASWEGFALESVIQAHQKRPEEVFFWRSHDGMEVDLCFQEGADMLGFEFKYALNIKVSASMLGALDALNLKKLFIVYPGDKSYALHERIWVQPLKHYKAPGVIDNG